VPDLGIRRTSSAAALVSSIACRSAWYSAVQPLAWRQSTTAPRSERTNCVGRFTWSSLGCHLKRRGLTVVSSVLNVTMVRESHATKTSHSCMMAALEGVNLPTASSLIDPLKSRAATKFVLRETFVTSTYCWQTGALCLKPRCTRQTAMAEPQLQ
jgi:hypothetical protein